MSEHLQHTPKLEIAPKSPERSSERLERHTVSAVIKEHNLSTEHKNDDISRIQQSIDLHARTAAEITAAGQEKPPAVSAPPPNSQIKQLGFERSMIRVRKKLPPAQKVLSKAMHQPAIESASEAGANTIARPWGILGGAIAAFCGSLALLWAANHYGFRYNFFAFVVLFIAGFGLGLLCELITKLIRRAC